MDDDIRKLLSIIYEYRDEIASLRSDQKCLQNQLSTLQAELAYSRDLASTLEAKLAKALAERDPFLPDAKEATK